jgi:hypothetical protein
MKYITIKQEMNMAFEKNYVVGVVNNGVNLYYKHSTPSTDEADFTFVCSQAMHFDDKFVADALADSLGELGYDSFVDDFLSIKFGE